LKAGQQVSPPPCGRLVSESASRRRISTWLRLAAQLYSRHLDGRRKATTRATGLTS